MGTVLLNQHCQILQGIVDPRDTMYQRVDPSEQMEVQCREWDHSPLGLVLHLQDHLLL